MNETKSRLVDNCPADKTVVRILLVSGQKNDYVVDPLISVQEFLKLCFNQWPSGKFNHKPITATVLGGVLIRVNITGS